MMRIRAAVGAFILLAMVVLVAGAPAGDASPATRELAFADRAASSCESGIGTPNPADVYCAEMGYQTRAVEEASGVRAECVFPDGTSCDAWQFFTGECGAAFSYCAANGYDQVTKRDGQDPFSQHYAVCMAGGQEVGSVSDLTGLSQRYNEPGLPASRSGISLPQVVSPPGTLVPAAFDWRDYNGQDWMTPVGDQAQCGTCWAFSAVGTVEAAYNIATNFPALDLDISEEFLNSDCPSPDPGSCCGGSHTGALEIIRDDGIPDEDCMPWDVPYYASGACSCGDTGCNPICNGMPTSCSNMLCGQQCGDWASRLITIDSFHYVANNQAAIKQAIVDEGPLAVCLAMRGTWDAQGIYRCTNCWDLNHNGTCETVGVCGAGNVCTSGLIGEPCDNDGDCDEDKDNNGVCNQDDCGTNHCVVMVGYDDAAGAWWLKNSWGAGWHTYGGYFPIGYGECHIEQYVYYVDADDLNFPPIADANGPYAAECGGATTTVQLDGSATADPNAGDMLTYAWTTSCPGGTFDDASSVTPILTLDSAAGSVCPLSCDVTLLVTDQDGAFDSATAGVTVEDSDAPELLGVPADETVECDAVPPPATVTAIDTCDPSPEVVFTEVLIGGTCPDSYTLERTWTATDECGNSTSQTQIITVVDTTAPVLAGVPPDETVECDAVPPPAMVTATDNCDESPVIDFAEVRIDGDCPDNYTLERTWTATDVCGNVSSQTQVITVQDTTGPIIASNAPATITPPDAPISFTATATDNCDGNPFVELIAYDCFAYKHGKRISKLESCEVELSGATVTIFDSGGIDCHITWDIRAVDSCGNQTLEQHEVIVVRHRPHRR